MKVILALLFFFTFSLSAMAIQTNLTEPKTELGSKIDSFKVDKKTFTLPMFFIQRKDTAKKD